MPSKVLTCSYQTPIISRVLLQLGGAHGATDANTVLASSVGNVQSPSKKTLTFTQEQEGMRSDTICMSWNVSWLEVHHPDAVPADRCSLTAASTTISSVSTPTVSSSVMIHTTLPLLMIPTTLPSVMIPTTSPALMAPTVSPSVMIPTISSALMAPLLLMSLLWRWLPLCLLY